MPKTTNWRVIQEKMPPERRARVEQRTKEILDEWRSTHLYEILVPTKYGDTLKPISTKHHKNWDAQVRKLTGGLTILTPGKGQWVYKDYLYEERVIPVRIMTNAKTMERIVKFTLSHYRQKAVMYYRISDECRIIYA